MPVRGRTTALFRHGPLRAINISGPAASERSSPCPHKGQEKQYFREDLTS
nr:hypothetical protein DWUX_155 [Desulfovibrio diazotrophicus]